MTHLVALFALDAGKLRVKCRPFLTTMKHTRPGNVTGWLPSLGLVTVLPSLYYFFPSPRAPGLIALLVIPVKSFFLKNRIRPGQEEHSGEKMVLGSDKPGGQGPL